VNPSNIGWVQAGDEGQSLGWAGSEAEADSPSGKVGQPTAGKVNDTIVP
jgi:hypothetical protein